MAKALIGAVMSPVDVRLLADNRRLRARVQELEAELSHLRELNDMLVGRISVSDDLLEIVPQGEPVLT